MSYYRMLGLVKEPFSTSPDPAFFYESASHKAAYYRLQIAIKLKRGLSVILGDVGVGKTTLSRRLLQVLKKDDKIVSHLILNPFYQTESEFLTALLRLLSLSKDAILPEAGEVTALDALAELERYLFEKGVKEDRTVVLVIDEAQRLSASALEVLRTLLNYETNEYKLLQLVLMGQIELLPRLRGIKNFWDRISLRYVINPLDETETGAMIAFRLGQAGSDRPKTLFAPEAVHRIYLHSQGTPRQIARLCHDALEQLVVSNKRSVDSEIIDKIIHEESQLLGSLL